MATDLTDPNPLESEDSAQPYSQSPWPDDVIGSASPFPSMEPSGSFLYPTREGHARGLLGDVQPHWTTTAGGKPLADVWRSESNPGGQSDDAAPVQNNYFDDRLAHPDDGGILWIGNPANPRLRREWSRKEGREWPRDPVTGRLYDVAHIVAKADGGKDHVDNIRPMHPDDHRAEHIANGDFSRWARRRGSAPTSGGGVVRSIGPLSLFSDLLGLVSGRIRTDSFNDFMSDMVGVPSPEDEERGIEIQQKALNPNWKPGDPLGI